MTDVYGVLVRLNLFIAENSDHQIMSDNLFINSGHCVGQGVQKCFFLHTIRNQIYHNMISYVGRIGNLPQRIIYIYICGLNDSENVTFLLH